MGIRNKVVSAVTATAIGLSALVGGCSGNSSKKLYGLEYNVQISPTDMAVQETDRRPDLKIRFTNLWWHGDEGSITYYNDGVGIIAISAKGSLTDAIPYYLSAAHSTFDLRRDTKEIKALAERVKAKWDEICKRFDCKGLEEKQRNGEYTPIDVKL